MNKLKAIKGTYDILPADIIAWQKVEKVVRETMDVFAYCEIRTPIFEETGLFARSIGEDTDIVGKEMYSFTDMGGRSLTLRPEGTASVVRSFIEHSLDQKGLPQNLWYMGQMFRQERPQKGRQRQFHQFGAEVIGSSSPAVDAEVMILFDRIADSLGLKDRSFSLNSIGDTESRAIYKDALVSFLDEVEDGLCDDCKRRKTTNPLRILDCKVPGCKTIIHESGNLPKAIDSLIEADRAHFDAVRGYLDSAKITYKIDNLMVRGLDYYTGTVFEMSCAGLGAQSAVMGGGRYNNLVKELGGKDMPAVGFACGMERFILAINAANDSSVDEIAPVTACLVIPEPDLRERAFRYLGILRDNGISATMDFMDKSMKAQMKAASRLNAEYVLILESEENMVTVKNMAQSEQNTMTLGSYIQLYK